MAGAGSPSGRQAATRTALSASLLQRARARTTSTSPPDIRGGFGTFSLSESHTIPSQGTCLASSSEAFPSSLATYEPTTTNTRPQVVGCRLRTTDVTVPQLQRFISRLAAAVHKADPRAKVTVGAHSMPYCSDAQVSHLRSTVSTSVWRPPGCGCSSPESYLLTARYYLVSCASVRSRPTYRCLVVSFPN